MKLLAIATICAGFAAAQAVPPVQSQTTDTTTNTSSKHHGKDVKSQSNTTSVANDGMGDVSAHSTSTTTKTKKHHGKVKTKTTTKDSGSRQ
jgi:hypothetical protein